MPAERQRIVADLVYYWREAGLDDRAIDEMRIEMETHLDETASHGGRPDIVVSDLGRLAEQWAEARVGHRVPSWADVQSGRARKPRATRRDIDSLWIRRGCPGERGCSSRTRRSERGQ